MPRYRFVTIFISAYLASYIFFALLYLLQPLHCVPGIQADFSQVGAELWS